MLSFIMFFGFRKKTNIKDVNHLLSILGYNDDSPLILEFSKFHDTLRYRALPKKNLYPTKGDKNHRIFQEYYFTGSNPQLAKHYLISDIEYNLHIDIVDEISHQRNKLNVYLSHNAELNFSINLTEKIVKEIVDQFKFKKKITFSFDLFPFLDIRSQEFGVNLNDNNKDDLENENTYLIVGFRAFS